MTEHAMGWSYSEPTLTKRELFAAMAMQGLIASDTNMNYSEKVIGRMAVNQADALIEALNEGKEKP